MDWWIIDRLFIAEHLSVRHWIADSGQKWQQVLHICDRLRINQPLAANIEFTLREFKVQ